ncbi:hypothetical protein P43SY_002169 [Pythium insidiosum]|uniref:Serine protease n=1 Tax=Pythium insidiosum TaxID=114742 RepID=A0AAD5Q4Z8_PYTIN|nr:hypothetical protein P43SY_002169 [Pythium insidiosum]
MFKKAAIATALLVAALSSPTAYGWADAVQGLPVNEKGILQVGTTEPANIQARVGESREDVISYPGAQYIAVRFDSFDLPENDEVVIRNADFSVLYTYRGKGRNDAGSFFATHILGDKVFVQYIARSKEASNGQRLAYSIPAFARGFKPRPTESVCGKDDSEPAKCYTTSSDLPQAYTRAKAVARLLINGTSLCTGWLAGSEGHLFTNQHCIDDPALAASTDIEFNAESASCAEQCQIQLGCKGTIVTSKSTFVTNNEERDYAVLKLPATADIQTYGYLQLRASGPQLGERIYIPQHPAGNAKRIAAKVDDGSPAKIEQVGAALSCGSNQVGYNADTQGGSSGSPVLGAADNLVVSLHHCGGCNNQGVDITDVINDLKAKNIQIKDLIVGSGAPTHSPVPTTPTPTTPKPTTPKPTTPKPTTPKPTTPKPTTPKPTTPKPSVCAGLTYSQCQDSLDCYWSWWRGVCRPFSS